MKPKGLKILLTGGAGFVGSHLAEKLLSLGSVVVNIDNFDPFYSRAVKESNMSTQICNPDYRFICSDINTPDVIVGQLAGFSPDVIIHLAAKAGVRPSILDPIGYAQTNVQGTINMLELARKLNVRKFIFASSSSVYGSNPHVPWKESDLALSPISPYASSKIGAEYFGKTYSALFGINFIALRFFTVFGPRQRPDLAIHKFFSALTSDQPIIIYGDGSTRRDYTYVSDIVNGIVGALNRPLVPGEAKVYNLGNSDTVTLSHLVSEIEKVVGQKFSINYQPEQAGDVSQTYADVSLAQNELNFQPSTGLREGLEEFYNWFRMSRP